MTRIQDVVLSPGRTGFYFDDQLAIKSGITQDGFFYNGDAMTPGFDAVRQSGESISILLLLDDGRVAHGDCAAVQYSGAGGRDPLFLADTFIPRLREFVAPELIGREAAGFRETADFFERFEIDGRRIHTALRYGLSQALLDAAAQAEGLLPCELIAREFGVELLAEPVRIFVQSGDDRYTNVDKMIIKGADVLPHALINNIPEKLGRRGEKLLEYVRWLRNRILERRLGPNYAPDLHIDVYGTIGMIFDQNVERMGAYLAELGEAAEPFSLLIEGPMDAGGRDAQCEALGALRRWLRERGVPVRVVADEWCNTLEDTRLFADAQAADVIQIKTPDLGGVQNSAEAVLHCRRAGVGAYLGGTCNETDRSAQMCVHVALATRPDQMLAKPGMGVDEGFMIVHNEMRRALALLERKREAAGKKA